jgi:hypothetical protein
MKIVCNVCRKMGYLQHLSKNYYRVRHYGGLNPITQKPRFEYHKQNPSYIDKVFKEQANNNEALSIDLIGQGNIDLNLNNNGSNLKNNVRGCPSLNRCGDVSTSLFGAFFPLFVLVIRNTILVIFCLGLVEVKILAVRCQKPNLTLVLFGLVSFRS